MIEVRPATFDDVRYCAAKALPEFGRKQDPREVFDGSIQVHALYKDGKVRATWGLRPTCTLGNAAIFWLVVADRDGVSKALFKACRAYVQYLALRWPEGFCLVDRSSQRAIKFARRCGFTLDPEPGDIYNEPEMCVLRLGKQCR